MRRCIHSAALIACLQLLPNLRAEEKKPVPAPEAGELSRQVVALFTSQCSRCHSGDEPRAKLDLTSLAALGRGSKRGAVVTPGKSTPGGDVTPDLR